MGNFLKILKRIFVYSNISEDTYNEAYPIIKMQIISDNKRNLSLFSFLATIIFAVIFIGSFFSYYISTFRYMCVVMFFFSFLFHIWNRNTCYPNISVMRIAMYVFIGVLLIF